jgi:hypothetical protein
MEKNTTSVGEERKRQISENPKNDITKSSFVKTPSEYLASGKYRLYFEYLDWLGLADETETLILSPDRHFYYDNEEVKHVKVLVNLKNLNHIRQVKEFLSTVNLAMENRSYLVGSFIDRKYQYGFFANSHYSSMDAHEGVDPVENGISSRIPLLNMLYDLIDSRTNNRNMTRKSVKMMLEITGFKVLDISEINGISCFCAQKSTSS